jgi:hypothetical protein
MNRKKGEENVRKETIKNTESEAEIYDNQKKGSQ